MVFVWISLWTIAAILLMTNPKNEATRWAALTAFTGGGGGLSRTVTETIVPYLAKHQLLNPALEYWLPKLHMMGSFMNHNGLPYCFLMYAISYSGYFQSKSKSVLAWILPTPIVIMLFITDFTPPITHNFLILFFWCVPYLLVGLGLLTTSMFKEKSKKRKRSRLVSNLVAFPPIIFQIVVNYTFKAFFHFTEFWRYMPLIITLLFLSFLLLGIKYGVLGVRLKFEKDRLFGTMRAVSYGTNVLNHTIKNEVGKIRIVTAEIQKLAVSAHQLKIMEDASTVLDSTQHMLDMVTRIQSQTQDIILKAEVHDVVNLLERAISHSKMISEERKVDVTLEHSDRMLNLFCDAIHLQESFHNIILNGIEAMEAGGKLVISIELQRNKLIICFKDSGRGSTSEEVANWFDPFYSTKHRKNHYGLGLSYCFNVMQQHGGSISVQSELDVGTAVKLEFPKRRIRLLSTPIAEMRDVGDNQSNAG